MRYVLALAVLALCSCGSGKKSSPPPAPVVPADYTLAVGTWDATCVQSDGLRYADRVGDLATFTVDSTGRLTGWAPEVMQLQAQPSDRFRCVCGADVYWLVLDIPGGEFGLIQGDGQQCEWDLERVPAGPG